MQDPGEKDICPQLIFNQKGTSNPPNWYKLSHRNFLKLHHILQAVINFMLMSGLQYVSKWKVSAKAIRTQAITECKISCLINHYWLQFIIFDLPTPCLWIDFHFWQVLPIHHFIEYLICMRGGSIWSGWCGSWIKVTPPFDQQLRYLNCPQFQKVLIRFTTLIQTMYYGNIWPIATNKPFHL